LKGRTIKLKVESLGIEGAWVCRFPVFNDERGSFREWFKTEELFQVTGRKFEPEQANISQSLKGVVRGIHYSLSNRGQSKWITCVSGNIRDFVIDIRPNSKTFGKWVEIDLTHESGVAVFISEGLGHAFISLEDNTTVAYLVSTPFSPSEEFAINPFDDDIAINWGLSRSEIIVSDKDKQAPSLESRKRDNLLPQQSSFLTQHAASDPTKKGENGF
jgi:dTDP-4-dehydrorhamnose 3,5-epimerase